MKKFVPEVNTTLVSVVMPVYNGEKHLRAAIDSVLLQTLKEFEFIIVDDGSTDSTPEILQTYHDDRLCIITNDKNKGVAFSLNRALDIASGDYIVRMDSDDIACPKRLEKQVDYLEQNPSIDLCGSAVNLMSETSSIKKYPKDHESIRVMHLFNPAFIHSTVCWRRQSFEKYHLRYQESPPTAEDYALWVRAQKVCRFSNLQEPLIHYRLDQSIKISDYLKQQYSGARKIRQDLLSEWIELSLSELEVHHKIAESSFECSTEFLQKSALHLNKLVEANGVEGIFDQKSLKMILGEYWYRILMVHVLEESLNMTGFFKIYRLSHVRIGMLRLFWLIYKMFFRFHIARKSRQHQ